MDHQRVLKERGKEGVIERERRGERERELENCTFSMVSQESGCGTGGAWATPSGQRRNFSPCAGVIKSMDVLASYSS